MSTGIGTPQHVVDAIDVIAAYLRAERFAECEVPPAGGAAFRLTRRADELLAGWERERTQRARMTRRAINLRRKVRKVVTLLSICTPPVAEVNHRFGIAANEWSLIRADDSPLPGWTRDGHSERVVDI